MQNLKNLFSELGISKVRLAKYLGVSRQMLYNYLAEEKIENWPKEKVMKILTLLGIKEIDELKDIKVDGEYIIQVENRLKDGVKEDNERFSTGELKGLSKKEQELLSDIIELLKEKLVDDKTKDVYNSYRYLYHFLQSMGTTKELKYILAYMSKSMGFVDHTEYVFNEEKQFIFESIMFSAMTLYNGGTASKAKISETHKRFVQEIEHKKEEVLSRTQELNTAKVQALKELGYTEINNTNAKEVLDKIAEIQSRKV